MTRSNAAHVKPALLVWARESIGLSQAAVAKLVDVDESRIKAWEEEEECPSIAQLRKYAEACRRPLAVFFLSEAPKTFDAMRDYRRLPEEGEIPECPPLNREILRATQRREVAIDLLEDAGEEVPEFGLRIAAATSNEDAGAKIRSFLGVALQEQSSWRDSDAALREWCRKVEARGALVFQTERVPLQVMRGFSISAVKLPVIVINGQDFPNGKIFTLFHELAHLALNAGGICDLHNQASRVPESDALEVRCNAIAAAALIPRADLLGHTILVNRDRSAMWSDSELGGLARGFNVSREAILRRLLTFGLVTEAFYQQKRTDYFEIYKQQMELRKKKQKDHPGGPPPYRMVIRGNGRSYTGMVLSAFRDKQITLSDVSDYLGMRVKHLREVEHALSTGMAVED